MQQRSQLNRHERDVARQLTVGLKRVQVFLVVHFAQFDHGRQYDRARNRRKRGRRTPRQKKAAQTRRILPHRREASQTAQDTSDERVSSDCRREHKAAAAFV